MKQVFIKKGDAFLADVPSPAINDDEILVKVYYSCISIGTELYKVQASGRPLLKKIMDQPQNIARVMETIENRGLKEALIKVKTKIESRNAIGYSAAGMVMAIGKNIKNIRTGDKVACTGDKIANHAEFIAVPENMAVALPQNISLKHASTVAIGIIAMQGVRRCKPEFGDIVAVIGLGIIGQITAQMLQNTGCKVIGIDIDNLRIEKALSLGMNYGFNTNNTNVVNETLNLTSGHGCDSVIVTASSGDEKVINQAMEMCRKKGKVVIVGNVNLNINREEFYKRELDLLISTSYGPGRYDESYEIKGIDYPYQYVRWTENRNMSEYISLLDKGKIEVESLIDKIYKLDDVSKAYEDLKTQVPKPLMVLLEYNSETIPGTKVIKKNIKFPGGSINIGIIGAGGFTREIHLPNLLKLDNLFNVYAVCDKIGSNADDIAEQYKASYSTTDFKEILNDDKVNMVLITTRHNLHAGIAIEAAKAGKAIFLEKPMALKSDELIFLTETLKSSNVPFMVGYNRRFSPFAIKIKEILNKRTNAFILNYRINAGFIPKENWVHSEEGGGRNIGEACHIYDLFAYFTDSEVESIGAIGINPRNSQYVFNDNFSAVLKFKDGSVCNLIYTSLGNPQIPKEQMELYTGNKIIYLNDYKELHIYGSKNDALKSKIQDKGHLNELRIFGESIKSSNGYPIPLWQLVQSSDISFEVEKQLR